MHMDGTCLSSILKISFLFGIFGQDFSGIGTYITCVCIAILGGVVMSGVPGGGLIGEMLIVNLFRIPAGGISDYCDNRIPRRPSGYLDQCNREIPLRP